MSGRSTARRTAVISAATVLVAMPMAVFLAAAGPAALAAGRAGAPAATPDGPAQARRLIAYVVNGTGTLTPVFGNGSTGPAITVGSDPIQAVFAPSGAAAYVATGDNAITPVTIDGAASTPGPQIHVGHDPVAIAITPNGKTALVANHNSPYGVTPISLANHHPGRRIKVGMAPEEIAITPNGRYAYVTNTTSDTVSVLDFPAGHAPHVIKTIRVGFSPEGISVTPNGKYAFVANNGSGTVSEIQISRDRVIHTIRTRGFPEAVAVTPNSKYAFVSDFTEQGDNWAADHTVTAITVATGAVRRQITVGHGPIALGATLDGLIVYVANWSSNTVTPIDVATATTAPAIGLAGQKEPVYIAIRP